MVGKFGGGNSDCLAIRFSTKVEDMLCSFSQSEKYLEEVITESTNFALDNIALFILVETNRRRMDFGFVILAHV